MSACHALTGDHPDHLWVNYGLKSDPVIGCFRCGCTPTDPTPESVRDCVRDARIAREGE